MPAPALTDFSDRLSPTLVKELRQGLRAKMFVAIFLGLQVFLSVTLLAAGAGTSNAEVGTLVSNLILGFFSIAVLAIQPMRGVAALASEVKGNTIDIMFLSRLSASRIVYGKWIAVVSQSALILSTIIPYLILRYFFGGMNLLAEMVLLALIFVTSMALTALTVGLSGCTSAFVRGIFPILGGPILIGMLLMLTVQGGLGELLDLANLDTAESMIAVGSYLAAIIWIGWCALSMGITSIAPSAENHSLVPRLVAAGAILVSAPFITSGKIASHFAALLLASIVAPVIVMALTERKRLIPTVCQKFFKWGLPGKMAGACLYPVWSSGVFYTVAISFLAGCVTLLHPAMRSVELQIVMLSILGALLLPGLLVSFAKNDDQKLGSYLVYLGGSVLLAWMIALITDVMSNEFILHLFIWNPLVCLVLLNDYGVDKPDLWNQITLVDSSILVLLVVRAIIAFRGYAGVFNQVVETPE